MRKLKPDELCWCGSEKMYRDCHSEFDKKIEFYKKKHAKVPSRDMIKTPEQVAMIRKAAEVNIAVLDYVAEHIRVGMTTQEIDDMVYQETTKRGAVPAPLNYNGFPKSVCTSINEVVCHGIPSSKRVLEDGDIINVDCTTVLDGYYADSSRMFEMGDVSEEKRKLVRVARECVELGLERVKPWGFLGDIADAVSKHAQANGFTVVPDIGGHGVGIDFHEEPFVSYVIRKGTGMLLAPGVMFTIEPMINMGTQFTNTSYKDGWTVTTRDGQPSAQWEIQVLVIEDGYEVISY